MVESGAGVLAHSLPDEFGYNAHLDLQGFLLRIQFCCVGQMLENGLHIVRDEVPLRQQLVKGRQKLLLNHRFAQVRRLATRALDEAGVALPDGAAVFVVEVPHLAAVHAPAAAAVNSAGEAVLAVVLTAQFPSTLQFQLHFLVNLVAHDGRVTVFDVVLRHLALVDLHLLCEEIRAEGLLQQCVALVFFVGEDAQNGSWLPCASAGW